MLFTEYFSRPFPSRNIQKIIFKSMMKYLQCRGCAPVDTTWCLPWALFTHYTSLCCLYDTQEIVQKLSLPMNLIELIIQITSEFICAHQRLFTSLSWRLTDGRNENIESRMTQLQFIENWNGTRRLYECGIFISRWINVVGDKLHSRLLAHSWPSKYVCISSTECVTARVLRLRETLILFNTSHHRK